jgi:hypothetical protein
MDELIPEGMSMPSASQAGCLAYLEATSAGSAAFADELLKAVQSLRDACLSDFGRDFERLEPQERVAALTRLEGRRDGSAWRALRDSVYEAYYTRPEIWRRLGYEFYPPERPGPRPPDFDESVLARVRTMPPLYRD